MLLHTVGWLQNFCFHNFTKFLRNLNSLLFIIIIYYFNYQNYFFKILCFPKFWQNNFNFAKFEENFAKRKIKNLAKHEIKIFVKLQKQRFRSHPTPTQSSVCYSPSPPVCYKILQCGTAMLLWDEDEDGTVLFHSVIYNSVFSTLLL